MGGLFGKIGAALGSTGMKKVAMAGPRAIKSAGGEKIGEGHVEVGMSDTGVAQGLASIQSQLEAVGEVARNVSIAAAGIAASIAALMYQGIKSASDYEETLNKFNAVFKEHAAEIREWADAFTDYAHLATSEVLGMLAMLQDTFVPLGFGRAEGAKLSKMIVQLANDLRSFNPQVKSTEEALTRMLSAIIGNRESVRQFGIIITENSLKAKMLEMGFKGLTGQAEVMAKALATIQIIMESTIDAQGDAAKTSEQWKNSLARLYSALHEVWDSVGKVWLPTAQKYLKIVIDIVDRIDDWVKANEKLVAGAYSAVIWIGALAVAAGAVWVVITILTSKVLLLTTASLHSVSFGLKVRANSIVSKMRLARCSKT